MLEIMLSLRFILFRGLRTPQSFLYVANVHCSHNARSQQHFLPMCLIRCRVFFISATHCSRCFPFRMWFEKIILAKDMCTQPQTFQLPISGPVSHRCCFTLWLLLGSVLYEICAHRQLKPPLFTYCRLLIRMSVWNIGS